MSDADYKVQEVVSRENWNGNRGEMTTYELLFVEIPQRTLKLNQMAKTKAPEIGDTIYGQPDGEKFVKGNKPGGFKGGGGGGTKDSDFERKMDHPTQMARVLHTSSLSTAPVLVEQMINFGIVERPADKRAYLDLVLYVADWVLTTYPKAVQDRAKESPA